MQIVANLGTKICTEDDQTISCLTFLVFRRHMKHGIHAISNLVKRGVNGLGDESLTSTYEIIFVNENDVAVQHRKQGQAIELLGFQKHNVFNVSQVSRKAVFSTHTVWDSWLQGLGFLPNALLLLMIRRNCLR